jgi:hypothetical protein
VAALAPGFGLQVVEPGDLGAAAFQGGDAPGDVGAGWGVDPEQDPQGLRRQGGGRRDVVDRVGDDSVGAAGLAEFGFAGSRRGEEGDEVRGESSTRRRPTSPAARATSSVLSKIRSGWAERASRARMSTSTVWTNPG